MKLNDCICLYTVVYRKSQRQTDAEMTNMTVFGNDAELDDGTSFYETLADNLSVYDVPLDETAGYDNPLDDTTGYEDLVNKTTGYEALVNDTAGNGNPITRDEVRYNSVTQASTAGGDKHAYGHIHEQPVTNVSMHNVTRPLSNDDIGQCNIPEPQTDTKYLVLLDDEGKLGNPLEVPPPRADNNTQEPPADTKYLVLLDDEGKLGNPPDIGTNNTQDPPAEHMYLELLNDDEEVISSK